MSDAPIVECIDQERKREEASSNEGEIAYNLGRQKKQYCVTPRPINNISQNLNNRKTKNIL